jgi:hypothetical protein
MNASNGFVGAWAMMLKVSGGRHRSKIPQLRELFVEEQEVRELAPL